MTLSLVTGGAGFVGQRLVAALKARGDHVRVLDLKETSGDCVVGSVTDQAAVERAVAGADCVFHLAGNAQLWSRSSDDFDAVNHRGTRIVLGAARRAEVKKFVQCSSLTTLVGASTPIGPSNADEGVALSAEAMLGPYPKSKRLADLAVGEAVRDGLDAVIAIPTEPLGAGDETLTPPSRLIVDLLNGRTPAVVDCTLNFVAVDSLAEGLIAARDKGRTGERYLLGGKNVSMRQLLATLHRLTGRKMPGVQLPYTFALAVGAIDTGVVARLTGRPPTAPLTGVRLAGRRVSFSSDKARRELGWTSRPFDDALAEAVDWFIERGLAPAQAG